MTPDPVLDPQGPPLPTRQIMSQWWRDITFLHWPVDPGLLAPLLPRGVRPDLFDGSAWVGLIPFRMVDAGISTGPPVPWLGTFAETNVRVYSVDDRGRHGVTFLSLEAQRLLVVLGARLGFNVPYQWASMGVRDQVAPDGRRVLSYTTHRATRAPVDGVGRPRSRVTVAVGEQLAQPSPLELFLTARFGLHTAVAGRTLWVPNTHGPWPLQSAEVLELEDELVVAAGLGTFARTTPPASVLFSTGVRTTFGFPQRL
ncbi:YqjF family protein [Pedococcus ginsenosidimutans]|uniref:YqjF family protein n=1 Tax=Pedococcus ginsenosidimutans TaxID=490570 RepID=A0ABP8Y0A7_9MICO